MAVYKDNNGTWHYEYFIKDKITGKRIHKTKRGFKTKREAQSAEVLSKEKPANITNVSFLSILEMYVKNSDGNETTKHRKIQIMNDYFPYLNDPIAKITKPMIMEWNTKIRTCDLSSSTKNMIIQTVKATYRFAHTYYEINDLSNLIKSAPQEKKTTELTVWSIEEFNQFIQCVKSPTYHAFFTFLFWTGCRRGEAIALLKSDISKDRIVTINKSMRRYQDGVKEPKTPSSVRKIKIDDSTYNELKPLLEREGNILFGDTDYLRTPTIQDVFNRSIKASGVKKIRIHDLRHSHATILINEGVNIVAVSKRLGHADISMTLRVYTHLLEKTDEQMMEKIDELHKNI